MTIAFELEGVLACMLDNENEGQYDAKISVRSAGNNIIN